jgi:hypothetical protein
MTLAFCNHFFAPFFFSFGFVVIPQLLHNSYEPYEMKSTVSIPSHPDGFLHLLEESNSTTYLRKYHKTLQDSSLVTNSSYRCCRCLACDAVLMGNTIYCLPLHGRINTEDWGSWLLCWTVQLHVLVNHNYNIQEHENLKPQQLLMLDMWWQVYRLDEFVRSGSGWCISRII